jgi:multiple sugar transport system ATP-binding protein
VIQLEHVSKQYGRNAPVVRDVCLEVAEGEFVALVGPSGSGKSTILRIVAGLSHASEGRILVGGVDVTGLPPQERDVAVVFQNYALYPHMSVRKNLEFGLKMRKTPIAERNTRVAEAATMLGLTDLLDRRPSQISGGQRQRVAMGRAIVRHPKAFLLDEPLSNLDALLRVQVRADLLQLHQALRTTTIYVTHDQVEAMTLGERTAVLKDGELQQVDTARGLYSSPVNAFVASFIGSPPMNLFRGVTDGQRVRLGNQWIPVNSNLPPGSWIDRELLIGVRPSSFESAEYCRESWPSLRVSVLGVEELGSETVVLFSPEDTQEGEGWPKGLASVRDTPFQARVNFRTDARAGSHLTLAIDPDAFYFFDPESQATIAYPKHASANVQIGT